MVLRDFVPFYSILVAVFRNRFVWFSSNTNKRNHPVFIISSSMNLFSWWGTTTPDETLLSAVVEQCSNPPLYWWEAYLYSKAQRNIIADRLLPSIPRGFCFNLSSNVLFWSWIFPVRWCSPLCCSILKQFRRFGCGEHNGLISLDVLWMRKSVEYSFLRILSKN
jgi:hypothetical protein